MIRPAGPPAGLSSMLIGKMIGTPGPGPDSFLPAPPQRSLSLAGNRAKRTGRSGEVPSLAGWHGQAGTGVAAGGCRGSLRDHGHHDSVE